MPILAQHGFACGTKIQNAIDRGYIEGCIFSPKDVPLDKLVSDIQTLNESDKNPKLYFDPQYYATTIVQKRNLSKVFSLCRSTRLSQTRCTVHRWLTRWQRPKATEANCSLTPVADIVCMLIRTTTLCHISISYRIR